MLWRRPKTIIIGTCAIFFLSAHGGRPAYNPETSSLVPGDEAVEAGITASQAGALIGRKDDRPYCLYLTFDDGPTEGSEFVNQLAREEGLALNVFLIGSNACRSLKSRELYDEYQANPLVEMGNHSFTHAAGHYRKYFARPSDVLADFNRSRDSLHLHNSLVRLPGRNFFRLDSLERDDWNNGKEASDMLASDGYKIYGWDIEWLRKPKKGIERHTGAEMLRIVNEMLENRKTFVPGRLILLLHDPELKDLRFREELDTFVRLARADGRYRFGHLSEYGEQ